MRIATRFVRPEMSPCASALGRYPSSDATLTIRSRVAGATLPPGVKHRDTADCETPAARATSWDVARLRAAPDGAVLRTLANPLSEQGGGPSYRNRGSGETEIRPAATPPVRRRRDDDGKIRVDPAIPDVYALQSYRRAAAVTGPGGLAGEIVPLSNGEEDALHQVDEELRFDTAAADIAIVEAS